MDYRVCLYIPNEASINSCFISGNNLFGLFNICMFIYTTLITITSNASFAINYCTACTYIYGRSYIYDCIQYRINIYTIVAINMDVRSFFLILNPPLIINPPSLRFGGGENLPFPGSLRIPSVAARPHTTRRFMGSLLGFFFFWFGAFLKSSI